MAKRIKRGARLSSSAVALDTGGGWQLWFVGPAKGRARCAVCSKALPDGRGVFRRLAHGLVREYMCRPCVTDGIG